MPFIVPDDIETPSVVVSLARLKRNLQRIQDIADGNGVKLRPHVKTHKSLEIGRLQLDLGATGITAAKPDEAIVFIEAGFPSVTVAYPIADIRKLDRLLKAARGRGTDLRLIADSLSLVDGLARAAERQGIDVGVFMKVDVGLGRVGVKPHSREAIEVARDIVDQKWLCFRGLIAHAGHSYGCAAIVEIAAIAEEERHTLLEVVERLRDEGLEVPEISVGSTPTVLGAEDFTGITEIRPGNYVFLDMTAVRLGIASLSDVALIVVATVVSYNDEFAIIDAGSKVLSSDLGPHGTSRITSYGRAFLPGDMEEPSFAVEKLSEEHGFVRHGGVSLPVGQRLFIVPNHACVVTNLVGKTCVVDEGSNEEWPVQAQACIR